MPSNQHKKELFDLLDFDSNFYHSSSATAHPSQKIGFQTASLAKITLQNVAWY